MPNNLLPGDPVLVVFREVLPGDIRKIRAESNISPTGGGARDLRFRHGDMMTQVIRRMFPEPTFQTGVVKGRVHWIDQDGIVQYTNIEFWRPTEVRPNEVRLGRINNLRGWYIDEEAYNASQQNRMKWFFLLVLDDTDTVWARLFQEEYIEFQTPLFREYLRQRIHTSRGNSAVFGAIDFTTLETTP